MRHRLEHIVKLVGLLSLVFFSTPVTSLASNNCSPIGYTILTLNGIFTNESDAIKNKNDLKDYLDEGHNSEPISIDYLHNPTHLDGWGDILEVYVQKVFDNRAVNLHDLDRMLYDASQKVRTQKVLLVAHSQGNFYANGFYDKVAGKEGGVPRESIGVYGIASPSSRVAGNGRWLTSDTDRVIAGLVARLPGDIMPPNTSIELTNASDKQGHDFANIYLKYEGTRIVNEIYASLDDLESNGVQTTESQCINTPKLTVAHKALDVVYAVADPLAGVAGKVVTTTTDGVKATGEGIAVAADYTSKGLKATGQVMGSGLAMVVNGVSGVLRAGGEFAGSGLAMVYNNIFDSQPAVKYAVSYTPASADEIVFVTGRVANTGMEETQRSVPVARVVESRPTATIDTASIYAALSQIASLQSQVLALRATEVEERERETCERMSYGG